MKCYTSAEGQDYKEGPPSSDIVANAEGEVMNQTQTIQMKEISEVRNLVVQASWERPVPEEAAQDARDTMQVMYQEAAKYG